ncbi:S9 family peptidase [Paraglaciecola sp. L3A3]|uniref:alpha/beta hydrolase family protein n=1 Tax=Paraglaciecola sp. L3A3 TaxID=2686358 RepID=UPI00131E9139|nr:prolyl oligopeptidase family serine peptidase [Paraglaciecola sp. L3A3]
MKAVYGLLIAGLFSFHLYAQNLISLDELLSKDTIHKIELNPKGDLLLTTGYEKNRLQLNVFEIDSGQLLNVFQAKQGADYRLSSVKWGDQDSFIFNTYRPLQKNAYVSWLVDLSTSSNGLSFKTSRIHARGYVIDYLPNEQDKVWFVYYPDASNYKKIQIYKTHTQGIVRENFRGQNKFKYLQSKARKYFTDPKGQVRFSSKFDKDDIEKTYWYLDQDNDWQLLFQFDPYEYDFEPIGFLPNGKLAVITNINSDLKSLHEFDLSSQTIGDIIYQHARYDVTAANFDQSGDKIESISYYDGGEWRSEYFDHNRQTLNQQFKNTFEGQQYFISSMSANEQRAVIKVFSSTNRGEYYLWDKTLNELARLKEQNAQLSVYEFSDTQVLDIKSDEGHKIEAFYTQSPENISNNVLLVMPHGGPIGPRDHKRFNFTVQYLVSRGYSVLQVNYRGSDGFGKEYKDSGRGQWGRVIEKDITSAVTFIHDKYKFKQTCAIGASYGGYSSAMLAILHPDTYSCVIARFGVFDLPLIFNDRNTKLAEYMQKIWSKVVGEESPELKKYSPVYLAEKINVPVLITAGELDTRASFEHSNRFKYVLKKLNKDVEHIYYRYAGHGHNGNAKSAKHELAYIDDFIRRKLSLSPPVGDNSVQIKVREFNLIANGFDNKDIAGVYKDKSANFKKRTKITLSN